MVALFADLISSGHDPGEGGGKLRAPSGPGRSRGCPGVPPPLLGVPSDSPGLIPDGGGGFWRGLGQIHFSVQKRSSLKSWQKKLFMNAKRRGRIPSAPLDVVENTEIVWVLQFSCVKIKKKYNKGSVIFIAREWFPSFGIVCEVW